MEEHFENSVDKIFKDALSQSKEVVPAGIWQGIENELDRYEVELIITKISKKRTRAGFLLFLIALISISTPIADSERLFVNGRLIFKTVRASTAMQHPLPIFVKTNYRSKLPDGEN